MFHKMVQCQHKANIKSALTIMVNLLDLRQNVPVCHIVLSHFTTIGLVQSPRVHRDLSLMLNSVKSTRLSSNLRQYISLLQLTSMFCFMEYMEYSEMQEYILCKIPMRNVPQW